LEQIQSIPKIFEERRNMVKIFIFVFIFLLMLFYALPLVEAQTDGFTYFVPNAAPQFYGSRGALLPAPNANLAADATF